jgi:protocatechuate 3,4-dioxygenase beta subunit
MRRTVVAGLAAAVILSSSMLASQSQPTTPGQTAQPGQLPSPPRTPPRVLRPGELPPKGSARIRGQVVAADTGAPIRRAQVRATAAETRGGGVTSTDPEGRFEIGDLPAGRYSIAVTKGGYVSLQFGQRRPGEQGTPLELSDGQAADKVNFALPRGAVITGRIVDDSGDPVSGTSVTAMRFGFMAGTRRLLPAFAQGSSDQTDDQGTYRLYGLPPGDYIVSATNRISMFNQPDVNNTEADAYAPTYYPGTPNLAEAARISVRTGQQQTGANFALTVARLARIRGRALNSSGEPIARAMIMLMPADPAATNFASTSSNAQPSADGSFQLPNVAPGSYVIQIRPSGLPGSANEFGRLPITVGSEDLDGVLITTLPGGVARGSIVTDDGSAPEFRPDLVQVFAMPLEMMMMPAGNSSGPVSEDFTFEIKSIFDRRQLRANVPTAMGWYFKGVYLDGVDVTDTGVEFTSGKTVDGLQIVMTRKTTDLSGSVLDSRGRPVVDASVVVFHSNRDRWGGVASRYLRTTRPDTEGRYRIRSLPPDDDYLVIAVQGLQEGQGGDPEFLARASAEAMRFALGEGETKVVNVRLSTLQP